MRNIIFAGVLVLSGCAGMNPLSMLMPDDPGIEVNAQVAKNASMEKSVLKVSTGTTQTADSITNSEQTQYQAQVINQIANDLAWWQWVIIIACVGAGLPSWGGYWLAITTVLSSPFKIFRK